MTPRKKILVISSGFYPQISPRSFRTTELVKELSRLGHQVKVITHRKGVLHDEFEKQFGIVIKDLGDLKFPNIKTDQKGKILSLITRIFRRGMNQLFEYPDVELMFQVKRALRMEKGYDLLISIAVPYPIHWGVASAINKDKTVAQVWIGDCGDPYMGDKADSFRKLFYFKYIEKWFCRKADFISVPTEGSIDGYYPEFREKIKVIPQGFNFEDITVNNEPVKNEVVTFGYAGGFIPGIRDPKALFDFLCAYDKPYKFIIYTGNTEMVLPYVTASKNRIEVRANIPRDKLLPELSKMDFLLNINNGTSVQTPSKLIDYAITKRPILSIESGMAEKEMIEEFLRGDYRNQFRVENLDKNNIKNVARQFLDLAELKND